MKIRIPKIVLTPGTSSLAHLSENLAAGELTLSPEVLAELDGVGRQKLWRFDKRQPAHGDI